MNGFLKGRSPKKNLTGASLFGGYFSNFSQKSEENHKLTLGKSLDNTKSGENSKTNNESDQDISPSPLKKFKDLKELNQEDLKQFSIKDQINKKQWHREAVKLIKNKILKQQQEETQKDSIIKQIQNNDYFDFKSQQQQNIVEEILIKNIKSIEDTNILIKIIQGLPLFYEDQHLFNDIPNLLAQNTFKLCYVPQYNTIFRQGQQADYFYIILEGKVQALINNEKYENHSIRRLARKRTGFTRLVSSVTNSVKDKDSWYTEQIYQDGEDFIRQTYPNTLNVKTMEPGEYFGEIALFSDGIRTATVVTLEDTYCMTIDKVGFEEITKFYKQQVVRQQLEFLSKISFFKDITNQNLIQIAYEIEKVQFQSGQVIFQQGDDVNYIYFIFQGQVEIQKQVENDTFQQQQQTIKDLQISKHKRNVVNKKVKSTISVSLLQGGSYFGEYEIVNNKVIRQFKAVSLSSDTIIYKYQKKKFLKCLKTYHSQQFQNIIEKLQKQWQWKLEQLENKKSDINNIKNIINESKKNSIIYENQNKFQTQKVYTQVSPKDIDDAGTDVPFMRSVRKINTILNLDKQNSQTKIESSKNIKMKQSLNTANISELEQKYLSKQLVAGKLQNNSFALNDSAKKYSTERNSFYKKQNQQNSLFSYENIDDELQNNNSFRKQKNTCLYLNFLTYMFLYIK